MNPHFIDAETEVQKALDQLLFHVWASNPHHLVADLQDFTGQEESCVSCPGTWEVGQAQGQPPSPVLILLPRVGGARGGDQGPLQ